jgi:hypothetical protein
MDTTTVAVAALGLASTLLAAWLTARLQTRGLVRTELVTARVAAYGDCAGALYELERVSYNRALTRLRTAGADDAALAQVVYEHNSAARAAIGRLAILSDREDLWQRLTEVRRRIRVMHDLASEAELRAEHDRLMELLEGILGDVRDRFDDFQKG